MDIPSLFMIPSAVSSGKVHSVFPNSTDADFDFNRDSDATRVNSEGLIERVGYYGSELVTDGDFSSSSNWYIGTGCSISNGQAIFSSASSGSGFTGQNANANICTIGKTYKVTFTIVSISEGGVKVRFPFNSSNIHTEAGTYTEYGVSTNADIYIQNSGTTTAVIDNVSVVEVLGDRARLNYEIEGGLVNTKPSLLLEPQSTNLVTYSEDFSQWVVDGQASISSNSIISPDGTRNSDKLIAGTTSGRQAIKFSVSQTGNLAFSIFAKKEEYSAIQLSDAQNASAFANFNLETGVVGSTGVYTASMVDMGNDWYRCIITWNASVAINAIRVGIVTTATSARVEQFAGNGINGLYIYGAQLEQLSYATSYIPTNGSTQTRAAETCNGAGTSSIFESTEGILYLEVTFNNLSNNTISLSDGTTDNRVTFVSSGTINRFKAQIKVGGSTVFSEHAQAIDNTQNFNKYAIKWKENDFALWCNGTERNTDTSGSTFSAGTLTTLRFDRGDGANDFHGKIRDIRVYNTKEMTDSEVDILLTKITS